MTMTRKTILVGPRITKDTITGMRTGFDLLVRGFENKSLPHEIINLSRDRRKSGFGEFSIHHALWTLGLLLKFYWNLIYSEVVYITIGTSRAGFLRDALLIWPSWILGKKIVLHLHGGGIRNFYANSPVMFQHMMKKTYAKADDIIVLGELLQNQFNFVPGYKEKTRIVPNGLPDGLIAEENVPKELTSEGVLNILYLSNMVPSKGYLDVLDACHLLKYIRQIPIRCDFCGAFLEIVADDQHQYDDPEGYFLREIQKHNLEDVVTYHGTVTGDRKQKMLKNAHVFVLPTYYPWEGQPISIIEALAFGIPVISTKYRGIPEQVIDGYNGFLVSPRRADEIANAIERMWDNPDLYQRLSKQAIDHFKSNFTQDVHLSRMISILQEKL